MYNEIINSVFKNLTLKVSAGPLNHPPKKVSSMHYHDEIELLLINAGDIRLATPNSSFIARSGDLFFINRRVPHETTTLNNNCYQSFIQFQPENFSNDNVNGISKYLSRFINIDKEPVIHFKNGNEASEEIKGYIFKIFDEWKSAAPGHELYIKGYVLSIMGFLARQGFLNDSSTFFKENAVEKVLPALLYIDKHYTEPITLDSLSKVMNLNPSYFCRLFKKATNSTFIEYLNFVRICKAEKMLSSTNNSIADISLELGFASVSYFNKIFRRFKNCTPTEYRKSKYLLK